VLDPSALVSIVIPNYNYAQFVGEAIESALALDWPRVEVIVVDDGSTDSSASVIERYASRGVAMLVQANSGQALACKAGFERSHGEIVIFLDSDDLLDSRLIKAMAPHWNPGVSKVQFQMKTVDAAGNDLGSVFPQYYRVPSPMQVRQWVLSAFAYVLGIAIWFGTDAQCRLNEAAGNLLYAVLAQVFDRRLQPERKILH